METISEAIRRGEPVDTSVRIAMGGTTIAADCVVPSRARGVVVFAHGTGSSRFSPRNRFVASALRTNGLATLLLDLLTLGEEDAETRAGSLGFDVAFLATRLIAAVEWFANCDGLDRLRRGYFGAGTGAAAALVAAAERPDLVHALVSRGGRPELAEPLLPRVRAPTLLIVPGEDPTVFATNREAYARLGCDKELEVVAGAGRLFEEPGALERVAHLARGWFERHLRVEAPGLSAAAR